MTKAIATYLPELHWDNLEQTFPHWASIINEGSTSFSPLLYSLSLMIRTALGEEYRVIDEKLTV